MVDEKNLREISELYPVSQMNNAYQIRFQEEFKKYDALPTSLIIQGFTRFPESSLPSVNVNAAKVVLKNRLAKILRDQESPEDFGCYID